MCSSLAREIVTCRANSTDFHVYDDPVMLSCGHVFCRSCCLNFALVSLDQTATCPTCRYRISFENLKEFVENLVAHETLAMMVKNYLDDRKLSLKTNDENETIKMKIIQTIDNCDEFLTEEKFDNLIKIRNQLKNSKEILQQRIDEYRQQFDRHERQMKMLLIEQKQTNETNFSQHQTVDVQLLSASIKDQIKLLRKRIDFVGLSRVEENIRRLNNEAERQLRFLTNETISLPTFSFSSVDSIVSKLFGSIPSSIDRIKTKTSGDTSLESIPSKSPMWSVVLPAIPSFLSVFSSNKSTSIFSCSSDGIFSVLICQTTGVRGDAARLVRTSKLFPTDRHVFVQSFNVFERFAMLHVFFTEKTIRDRDDFGVLFFFTHQAHLEYKPMPLKQRVEQFVVDENRLWAIDSTRRTIFSHRQPTSSNEIGFFLSKTDDFLSFRSNDEFLPHRLATNRRNLAILSRNLEEIHIYDKTSRELIFTSQFGVGRQMNVTQIDLFPKENDLLLRFDLSNDENVRRSLIIHFDSQNQPVGRIEVKNCLTSIVGPENEILVGFNLRTGILRCYS